LLCVNTMLALAHAIALADDQQGLAVLVPREFSIEESQPSQANLTAVVILLGQSNMVGRGRGETLDPVLLQRLSERALEYYAVNDACGAACNREGSDCGLPLFMQEHCTRDDHVSEQNHQPQLQPVRGQTWERAILGSASRFGPELTLGLSLSMDAPRAYARVVVIKRAVLGAGIALFSEGQPLYDGLLRDFAHVVERYGPEQTKPVGVLWMQGENDAKSESNASAYSARLRSLISRVRADLEAPSLPFLFPQLTAVNCERRPFLDRDVKSPEKRKFQDQVEAAFMAAEVEIPHARYVRGPWPTTSEAQGPRATPQHLMDAMAGTGVSWKDASSMAAEVCGHYSSSSLLRIGAAVGRNMAELLGWEHHDIAANVSSWAEYQDHEEASWATLRPADWETCPCAFPSPT